jgi:hypothetical protein
MLTLYQKILNHAGKMKHLNESILYLYNTLLRQYIEKHSKILIQNTTENVNERLQ